MADAGDAVAPNVQIDGKDDSEESPRSRTQRTPTLGNFIPEARPRRRSNPVTRKESKEVDSIKGAVPIANALVKVIEKEIEHSNARIEKLRRICPPKIEEGDGEHLLQKKETKGMFGKSQSNITVKFKDVKKQYEEAQHNLEEEKNSELSEDIRKAISNFKDIPLTLSTQEEAMDIGMRKNARALLKRASQNSSATLESLSNCTQQNMNQLKEHTKEKILDKFTETDLSQALARKQSKNRDGVPCEQAQGGDEGVLGGRSRRSFHNRHQPNHTPSRKTPSRKTPTRKTTRTPTRRHPRKTAPRTRRR